MTPNLRQSLIERADYMPGVADYKELLQEAHNLTGESIDQLRRKMGIATYKDWAEFLNEYGCKF